MYIDWDQVSQLFFLRCKLSSAFCIVHTVRSMLGGTCWPRWLLCVTLEANVGVRGANAHRAGVRGAGICGAGGGAGTGTYCSGSGSGTDSCSSAIYISSPPMSMVFGEVTMVDDRGYMLGDSILELCYSRTMFV